MNNIDHAPVDTEGSECEQTTCWCGAKGTYEELFDDEYLDKRCGGSGILYCQCGGDLCVCHNHGEVQCFGCQDCEDDEYIGEDY